MEKDIFANKRNSAFELMRIICIYFIILGHCTLASAENIEPYLGIIDNVGWFIKAFTVCSVNCFFLLTGFFADSERFRLGNVLYVWFKTFFYSVVIYLMVSGMTGNFKFTQLIGYCAPVFCKKYWYMQTYLVAALIVPYLGRLLESLDMKKHTFLLIVLMLFFSFHQTFWQVSTTLDTMQGYGIIWCLVLFIVGNWLKRYGNVIIERVSTLLWVMAYIAISIMIFVSNYLIVKFNVAQGVASRGNFYAYNSLTVFIQGICLFCFFIKLSKKISYVKKINIFGKNVLAGYLISAHPLLIFTLWTDVFDMPRFWNKPMIYVITAILLTAIVLYICILIDKIVDLVLGKISLRSVLHQTDKWLLFSTSRNNRELENEIERE